MAAAAHGTSSHPDERGERLAQEHRGRRHGHQRHQQLARPRAQRRAQDLGVAEAVERRLARGRQLHGLPGHEQDQEGRDERGQRAVVGLAEQSREDDGEDELDRVVAQRGGREPRGLAGVRARERSPAARTARPPSRRPSPSACPAPWRPTCSRGRAARAAWPSAARCSGRSTSSRTAATSSAGSSASTPVCPSTIASPRPPTRIAAVGVPQAAASNTVRHQPSADEAVSATHARASSRAFSSSSTWPWKVTRSAQRAALAPRPRARRGGRRRRRGRGAPRGSPRARRTAARCACTASGAPGR